MQLYNKFSKEDLNAQIEKETFKRKTLSFYRYVNIENTAEYRDYFYKKCAELKCLGRIYIAKEGINAQMNIPDYMSDNFLDFLESDKYLKNMPIKWAVEDNILSFIKLVVKVRKKIVADGLPDNSFDTTNVGNHLSPEQFHDLLGTEGSITVDMRNHYESEIGHFENAICPDVDTFREEMLLLEKTLAEHKDKKLLLYCTGGVRCEKASAYFKHKGFEDVNQLHGGIIAYAQRIKQLNWKSKFKGKNFVFDERLGESINGEVISKCHQCGAPCDVHTNCANKPCHLLFIQCPSCKEKYNNCCTDECTHIITLPAHEQEKYMAQFEGKISKNRSYRDKIRPKLEKKY